MKFGVQFPSVDKVAKFFKQYKFVLLIIVVGIFLLMLPSGREQNSSAESNAASMGEMEFSVAEFELKVGEMLSKVEGAGKVHVILTVRTGTERVLATNYETRKGEREEEQNEEIVIVSTDFGEEPVLIKQNYPTFQGALLICQGGDNPEVQLQLIRALSALTGLSSGRIVVCKGS